MHISDDLNKSLSNQVTHGVSLALALRIDRHSVWVTPDSRRDYGELREIGFANIEDRLYVVVFVQRGHVLRIISLRKANRREVRIYVEQT
jgi:uncharacterized DUF497 family protein